jgi:hypothetical protein
MHMYIARKNVPENREIAFILKGEMSFATETSLVVIRGLDPRIHHSRKMDHRVKPGDDDLSRL